MHSCLKLHAAISALCKYFITHNFPRKKPTQSASRLALLEKSVGSPGTATTWGIHTWEQPVAAANNLWHILKEYLLQRWSGAACADRSQSRLWMLAVIATAGSWQRAWSSTGTGHPGQPISGCSGSIIMWLRPQCTFFVPILELYHHFWKSILTTLPFTELDY